MANRVYIIPRRNDLAGMNVQITDLWPNNSQKNGVYDGQGQTCYVGACADTPGSTKVNGNAFVSGSRCTTLTTNPVISDTTGGGNDCYATAAAVFGLAAYLRERVAADPGVANTFLTFAQANNVAAAIRAEVEAGNALTVAAINTLLQAEVGDAATELTNAGGSNSFGSVEEVLRILSGEVYRTPRYTIITDAVPNFLALAGRQALVDAQLTSITGLVFVAQGGFLTSLENGYVGRPTLARTGFFNASLGAGHIAAFKAAKVVVNPAFQYGAGGTAVDIAGNAIPITDPTAVPPTVLGTHQILAVYDHQGNVL